MAIRLSTLCIIFIFLFSCSNLALVHPNSIKDLGTENIAPGNTVEVRHGTNDAVSAGVYQVPNDKVFVLTNISVQPINSGSGTLKVQFGQRIGNQDRAREYWILPNSEISQLNFGPGIVISSSSKLIIENESNSAGSIFVKLYGYEDTRK